MIITCQKLAFVVTILLVQLVFLIIFFVATNAFDELYSDFEALYGRQMQCLNADVECLHFNSMHCVTVIA